MTGIDGFLPALAGKGVRIARIDDDRGTLVAFGGNLSFSWQSSTQAARVEDRVKAPAMAVPGARRANITSVRPACGLPAATATEFDPCDDRQGRKPIIEIASGETELLAFLAGGPRTWRFS